MMYLGDYNEDDTLYFLWSTNSSAGASITRATNGTVSVYKDNGTTQSTAGITDTEDFDSLTGIHACTIDLSADAFYATGADYAVVLSAATIDGQTVNAVLAHFSIQNRYNPTPPTAAAIADQVWDEATSGHITAGSFGRAVQDIPASTTDAVWDEAIGGHAGTGSTGEALAAAGAAGDPWTTGLPGAYGAGSAGYIIGHNLDAAVSAIGGAAGAGAIAFTYTLTDAATGAPIGNAEVWVSTDSAGSAIIASGLTDALGVVVFYLDAGTYYLWRQKPGYNFDNPDTETVA